MGFKLAELFVPIRVDMAPMSQGLGLARRQLLGLAGAAGAMTVSMRGAFLGLAGLAAPMGYAVKQAIDLEHQYAQIKKTTGLTGEEFLKLKADLQAMATTMAGVSLDEINGIAEMAGRLGIQGRDGILSYTKAIASIKIALDDIPAEEAASSIASILNNFKLGPQSALSFASALNKLDDSSNATARDILDVTQRLAGTGSTLGLSPQKILALSSVLKEAGVNNEVAGSAFSQILGKMATDTKVFAKVAGVNLKDFTATLRADPLKAIQLLVKSLGGMEKLERFKALDQLGLDGVRTGNSFLQLANVIHKLDGSIAAAEDEWKTHASILREVKIRAQETGAQLTLLWNNVRLTAAGVGDLLLPVIRKLADTFGELSTEVRASVAAQDAKVSPWIQTMIDQVDNIGVVWRNWGDIVELVGVRIAGEIDHTTATMGAFADWIGAQFVNVIMDSLNMIGTVAENEFKNLIIIAKEALDVIKSGFTKPFKPKLFEAFEGIELRTEAFKAPARDKAFDQVQRDIEQRMVEREAKRLDDKAKRARDAANQPKQRDEAKKDEATGLAPPGKAKKGEDAKTEDLSSYVKRLAEGVFGKDEVKKTNELLAQGLAVNRQIRDAVDKKPNAMPAVAAGPE
jgi:TP901 family phage tail tape measure protein